MSTTPENPNQGQPPYQPPQQPGESAPAYNPNPQGPGGGSPERPTGGEPQPPQQPGYASPQHQTQQPQYQAPQQGYGAPQQPAQGNGFKFEMPADAPKSLNDVMPKGGFSGIFNTNGLPSLLKISYLIWIIGAGLWLLTTVIGFVVSLVQLGFGFSAATGARGTIVSIIAFVVIAAIVVSAMKLKEGLQWPRMALSILAVISFILIFFGAGIGFLGVIAAVLMWLPESSAWINSRKGTSA